MRCWQHVVTTSSDFARQHAAFFGMAASMNLITTQIGRNRFASAWQITERGLRWLRETKTL